MIPNLDAMSADELWAWWRKHKGGREHWLILQGDARAKTVVHFLASYALHKSVAMRLRAMGDIRGAEIQEQECDRIYNLLPVDYRW